ncbi:MAG: hypothetical protein IJD47_01365 [Clostridia bacterium]|nr:hypothetical protein [Clostridia bacterium]
MKRRTLKSLMKPFKTVYVFIYSEWTAQAFFALAKYEGFSLDAISLQRGCEFDRRLIIRLNDDMTLTIIKPHNWGSAMLYHHILNGEKAKNEIFVDFETMLYR